MVRRSVEVTDSHRKPTTACHAPRLIETVSTRSDGPALNGALASTGRLLAAFSLLLSAGVLLS